VRAAGLPVDVQIEGVWRALPAGLELSAYRIVQEALTNVIKHAGAARATVRLRYEAQGLSIEVSDDGDGEPLDAPNTRGRGHGLVGMRERASIVGGTLDAAPDPHGGFAVRSYLPFVSA